MARQARAVRQEVHDAQAIGDPGVVQPQVRRSRGAGAPLEEAAVHEGTHRRRRERLRGGPDSKQCARGDRQFCLQVGQRPHPAAKTTSPSRTAAIAHPGTSHAVNCSTTNRSMLCTSCLPRSPRGISAHYRTPTQNARSGALLASTGLRRHLYRTAGQHAVIRGTFRDAGGPADPRSAQLRGMQAFWCAACQGRAGITWWRRSAAVLPGHRTWFGPGIPNPASQRGSDWSRDRIRRLLLALCQSPVRNLQISKPSPGALLSNWITYDAPFAAKLRMAASNTFIKLRKRQACCGNNGQPGC